MRIIEHKQDPDSRPGPAFSHAPCHALRVVSVVSVTKNFLQAYPLEFQGSCGGVKLVPWNLLQEMDARCTLS